MPQRYFSKNFGKSSLMAELVREFWLMITLSPMRIRWGIEIYSSDWELGAIVFLTVLKNFVEF